MPEEKTIGSELRLLDSLLDEETRLVKKYLLDSEGKLKMYHPITQRIMYSFMKEHGLLEELKAYQEEQKNKKAK